MIKSKCMGNEIYYDKKDSVWKYVDDNSTISKGCIVCGCKTNPQGHDSCIQNLPSVLNACCGHGNPEDSYTVLIDGTLISGKDSVDIQNILKKYR